MKIKSSKNIDMKKLLIAWIVGAIILIPTRIYQLLTIVDAEQGFYLKTDFTVTLMYVLLVVLVIVFFAGSLLSSKIPKCETNFFGNKVLGCVSFVVGIAMIADVVTQGAAFLEIYKGFGSQFGVTTMNMGDYMMKSGALSKLGEGIFALCSAVYFFVLGISSFVERINISKFKILALSPLVWAICRMLTKLIRTISYVKVSDLFYEIIMLLFMMLFFMAFAQVNSKINDKGLEWKLYGYGFFASLMALLCSVPRVFVMIIGKSDCLSPDAPVEMWDLVLAIFIIVYLVHFMSRKKTVKTEAEE